MSDTATVAHGHGEHDDDGAVHAHISSVGFYLLILLTLLFLTAVTVGCALVDFGSFNIVIAIGVATVKASLVAAFFMHLRYDKLFNTLAFLAAFLFLAIFLLLTSDDLWKRGEVDLSYGQKDHNVFTATRQPGPAESAEVKGGVEREPKIETGKMKN